jgi:hypothetical protein
VIALPGEHRSFSRENADRFQKRMAIGFSGESVIGLRENPHTPHGQDGKLPKTPGGHNRLDCSDIVAAGAGGRGSIGRHCGRNPAALMNMM